ncbi:hypothetical protein EDD85DRAFT_1027690 [Armillaria nabsnona]|nr:hypothetical protein EDD85DRAFT_1027690 [Armillaria nabsnona]
MCAKERVFLFRLPCAFLDIVIDMLFTLPSSDPRCLTHLKLDFREPILNEDVYMLTHTLRSYPMKVLVLDGILGGYPPIIKDIATHLLDLLVLTLVLRGDSNQSASTHCLWPKPMWMCTFEWTQWNYQYCCDKLITPWSMLLLEGYDNQDDFVQPYWGYESDGASVFKVYYRAPELRVVYRLDSAVYYWLVGDDVPIPDRTLNVLNRVVPMLEWNPQMVADCLEDSYGW